MLTPAMKRYSKGLLWPLLLASHLEGCHPEDRETRVTQNCHIGLYFLTCPVYTELACST